MWENLLSMNRVLRLVLLCVVASALLGEHSWGHDHRPPVAVLRGNGERQEGRPLASFWSRADGDDLCVDSDRSNSLAWQRAIVVPVSSMPRIIFWKPHPPTSIELVAWRRLDSGGRPRGEPERLNFVLAPRRNQEGQTVAWKAVITTGATARHYYVRARGQWKDEEGCGGSPDLGYQHASWTFHFRTR
jgi:hypothetical protein